MLTSALGAGALVGVLTLARRGGKPTHMIVAGSAALFGLLEALAGQSGSLVVTLLLIAATGAMMSTFSASANTTVQLSAPPEMRGRVMSVYTTIFIGTTPIGNLMASSVAAAFGTSAAFVVTGAPCLLAAGVAAWLWSRERQPNRATTATITDRTEMALAAEAETRLGGDVQPESLPAASGIHDAQPRPRPDDHK